MCCRFTQISKANKIEDKYLCKFADPEIAGETIPRYNVAPSQDVIVLRADEKENRELVSMKWGLVPSWAKDSKLKFNTVNARAEGLRESLVYKEPFRRTRCIVPADGFFEWKATSKPKQPYYIFPSERGDLFSFAALYDEWRGLDGTVLNTFSIITTSANQAMEKIHHRMPVILDDDDVESWLKNSNYSDKQLEDLLKPCSSGKIDMHGVTNRVNKVTFDGPEVLEQYEPLEWDF